MSELERLASTCILPGFAGPSLPDWVRRRLGEGLGGVVLYGWNIESPDQVRELTAAVRAERPGAIVAIDEEGGDVTRLEAATGSSYPGNGALGVADDEELTRRVATSLGAELHGVGVNLDLAPVADVNTNPENPVIGIRAFGGDPALVARHVAAFVDGLQTAGVAACAKHFPGHGDTSVDSHLALPVVERLEDAALSPFRAAVAAGVRAVMTAHVVVRSVGETPATLSRELVRDVLRGELGFDGMVVTDALEMRAISETVGVEEGAVRAIDAGADALCLGHDLFDAAVVRVRDALVAGVTSSRIPEERLRDAAGRVERLLAFDHGSAVVDRAVGAEAARRALRVEGDARITGPAVVVELVPEVGMAAGRLSQLPGEWLSAALPGAELQRYELELPTDLGLDDERVLVVLVRDAHRHAWERAAVEELTARAGRTIVIELGLPVWRPPRASAYVATHGAARVNVEAAAEALYSGPRRGVEQSGSSPGS